MAEEIDMERVKPAVHDLSYPIMRTDAAVELNSVVLGQSESDSGKTLGAIVSEMDEDVFDSPEPILDELRNWSPGDEPAGP